MRPFSAFRCSSRVYVAHEFGHTLGLPDFYEDTTGLQNVVAIMNDHGVAQDIKDEDLEQLKAIYILHTSH